MIGLIIRNAILLMILSMPLHTHVQLRDEVERRNVSRREM